MKPKVKITVGLVALFSVILYLSFVADTFPIGNYKTWRQYAGGPDQSKYFDGKQINKSNVSKLEVAFVYPTVDSLPNFFSPIVVDTVMYVMAKNSSIVAIGATSGKEIWIHANLQGLTRRGINYWESKDRTDRRLIFTLNNTLQAIDAQTGKTITSFGTNGYTDMREGLGREVTSIRRMQSMMPGVIYDDLIVMGNAPGEGYFSPPGYVRAYSVVTGKLEWTFHTVPRPGEFGYETWPKDAYKYVGGANVWGEISIDAKRGIAYLPIGSPTFDFYGADRLGANLFGNCLVAVDARTGKRLWHYQTVHHDIWDVDLTSAPQLITVKRKGKTIDAVAVATKNGMVFVFDRVTGEPVFPIEEKPFPASTMPGEQAWPTQPIPSIPQFIRNQLTRENLNPYLSDAEKVTWGKRIDAAKSGLYVPLSDQYETFTVPGALGGANFGNSASDPSKGMFYVITQEHPSIYKLERIKPPVELMSADDVDRAKVLYTSSCQGCHGEDMRGVGIAPSLVNAGQRVSFDDFKTVLSVGKGQMPGFAHIDEQRVAAIYRYLGGSTGGRGGAAFAGGRRGGAPPMPAGPVVASGGATVAPDGKVALPMADYPDGVAHPKDRYTTDYGTNWPNLLNPVWSRVVAYDLNKGIIKWESPVGEDLLSMEKGLKVGTPAGSLRKGMIVTSSGILFATAKGGKLYALDSQTGKQLWETTLSFESNAQPTMYEANGRQYLVVNATGNFSRDTFNHSRKPGALPRGYVVYALPSTKKK
jgi:quinoprotein glucose dehydrogenase